MKRYFALALAAAAGGFAATAVSGLYAATVKPIYVVLEIDEITDADGFKNTFQRKTVRELLITKWRYCELSSASQKFKVTSLQKIQQKTEKFCLKKTKQKQVMQFLNEKK